MEIKKTNNRTFSLKKVLFPSTEEEWLQKNIFTTEILKVAENTIRCALVDTKQKNILVAMVGGVPRDESVRKKLSLIPTFFGHLAETLESIGISSIMYNHPDTGLSSGDWTKDTLLSRSSVFAKITSYFRTATSSKEVALVGVSAGGYMVIKALKELQSNGVTVTKIVLISPAAYPGTIETIPYGDVFTKILRTPWDVRTSPIFPILTKFVQNGGSVLLAFFEDDDPPIPLHIQEYYTHVAKELSKDGGKVELLKIMGAAHNFRKISKSENVVNPESIVETSNEIISFLKKRS